ncbi:MAG: hypothetical protein ABI619_04155 [Betaproteobacteria bacterium]
MNSEVPNRIVCRGSIIAKRSGLVSPLLNNLNKHVARFGMDQADTAEQVASEDNEQARYAWLKHLPHCGQSEATTITNNQKHFYSPNTDRASRSAGHSQSESCD